MGRDPIRSCLVCRRRAAQRTLVRLTVVDGALAVDPAYVCRDGYVCRGGFSPRGGSGPSSVPRRGRGAYVCSVPPCIDEALRNDARRARRALAAQAATVVDVATIRETWQAAAKAANDTSAAAAATGVCE